MKRVIISVFACFALIAAALSSASPASATGTLIYTQPGRPAAVATCQGTPASCGNIGSYFPPNGRGATMLCWIKSTDYNGNYDSTVYFHVNISGLSGVWFIHSSYVYYQTTVGPC